MAAVRLWPKRREDSTRTSVATARGRWLAAMDTYTDRLSELYGDEGISLGVLTGGARIEWPEGSEPGEQPGPSLLEVTGLRAGWRVEATLEAGGSSLEMYHSPSLVDVKANGVQCEDDDGPWWDALLDLTARELVRLSLAGLSAREARRAWREQREAREQAELERARRDFAG